MISLKIATLYYSIIYINKLSRHSILIYSLILFTCLSFSQHNLTLSTSLLRALLSINKKTSGTAAEEITDGIEIHNLKLKADNNVDINYSTWDFAGQTLYYNTHQVSQKFFKFNQFISLSE